MTTIPSIYEMLLDQNKVSSSALSITSGEQELTCSQFTDQINKLSYLLSDVGLVPGNVVILSLERSILYPLTFFALLKIGVVIIPMDPTHSMQRFDKITDLYPIRFIISDNNQPNNINSNISVLNIKEIYNHLSQHDIHYKQNYSSDLKSSGYIMFTSGSTGEPKSIFISQHSMSCYITALKKRVQLTSSDVYLHLASISFSSSVRQMLLPLISGCSLILAQQSHRTQLSQLIDLIISKKISVLDITPSHIDALITIIDKNSSLKAAIQNNSIRMILTASEPLTKSSVIKIRDTFGLSVGLINMYGQTETAGIVSTYTVKSNFLSENEVIPLGKALGNIDIRIFDEKLNVLPDGEVGEICISGETLCTDYHNESDNSEQLFFNVTENNDTQKFIKTGDYGKKGRNNVIEFVSRKSALIKIRGMRVDLQEVKRKLMEHENVDNAVIFYLDERETPEIVCLIVFSCQQPTQQELRSFLLEKLDYYMIPTQFVFSKELTVTNNFKVDYQKIREMFNDQPRPIYKKENRAVVLDDIEKSLYDIWTSEFLSKKITKESNFFDLGGHSLLAARIVEIINQTFSVNLNLIDIFQNETIEKLASYVREKKENSFENKEK